MDFWEEITESPDKQSIMTQRGLRISYGKKELNKFFGSLLEKRPLEHLIGETAYWVLIPSLVSIYSFPIILFVTRNPWYSLMSSIGLMISMSVFNQSSYNYVINKYLVRPAASLLAKLTINLVGVYLLYTADVSMWLVVLPFMWWILNDFVPLVYLLFEMLLIKVKAMMWNLADPDGVLRQVGVYWAKKYNLKINENGKVIG